MASKVFFVFCTLLSFFGKSVLSQCIGRESILGVGMPNTFGWPYDGPLDSFALAPFSAPFGTGWPEAVSPFAPACGLAATNGGGLAVTSTSPIAPTGLTVASENTVEGILAMTGQLPFLGAVATDGIFSTVGAGAVSYGCGDGTIGIVAEAPISAPAVSSALGYGTGVPQYGYGSAIPGYNSVAPFGVCGCGALY